MKSEQFLFQVNTLRNSPMMWDTTEIPGVPMRSVEAGVENT